MTRKSIRVGLPPAMLLIATMSSCIFNFDEFEPPSGMNAKCLVPDSTVVGNKGGAMYLYEFETTAGQASCYAMFNENIIWSDAAWRCQELKSGEAILNAQLVEVSNLDEHKAILSWLKKLFLGDGGENVDFGGPWTLGQRRPKSNKWSEPLESDPLNPGAFFWAVNPIDHSSQENPPWEIFPSEGCKDADCQEKYWGYSYYVNNMKEVVEEPQPDTSKLGNCVRYGVSTRWNPTNDPNSPGRPGLADDSCTNKRPYICEWPLKQQ